jgi:hypothetical protein
MTRVFTHSLIFCSLIIGVLSASAQAAIYQYTDEAGTRQLVTNPDHVPPRYKADMIMLEDDQSQREFRPGNAPTINGNDYDRPAVSPSLNSDNAGQMADALQAIKLEAPSTWNDYAMLAGGLILLLFAVRMFHGFLRLAVMVCGLAAIGMFIADQFPETQVAKGLRAVGTTVAEPIKTVHAKVAKKVGATATAPMQAVQRVKGAIDNSNDKATERLKILETLGADD